MNDWISVKEAANILQCSDRHVRNMAATGKLKARKQGNLWLIHSSLQESDKEAEGTPRESMSESERITAFIKENLWLKERIENQEKELSELRREISESRNRSDTIIMQMTRQLPQKSFLQRLFGRSKK